MGPFEFVIVLVLIITVGVGVITRRSPRRELKGDASQGGQGELERIRDTVDDLSGRLERIEKERDFYKDLLEAPRRRREISPPDIEKDVSEG